ncbi:hypothetical protein [Proteiniborus sp. MB09-C3]|uniref:hypothetical protein n=1 Tax=Proteiniborus sp. MB09-C3 TaxID=3050072 RepID=UPI0025576AEC|nr:hypothetical protein [Proteiniborus sp. MB09-C3]WIV10524.1 hypothetical protein QO263_10165 [Proteiniborus sp. MB09-C3]
MKKSMEEQRELQNLEWIDLLCQHGSHEEFESIKENAKCTALAIMEYRGILMDRGIGKHITDKHLKAGNISPVEELQFYLQLMFLEPISIKKIEYFYESATKRGYKSLNDAVEELYRRHIKDTGKRFMSIVLSI